MISLGLSWSGISPQEIFRTKDFKLSNEEHLDLKRVLNNIHVLSWHYSITVVTFELFTVPHSHGSIWTTDVYFHPTICLFICSLSVLRTRAVGIKSGPSLAEHVHPDLASSAKLVSRVAA